MTSGPSTPRERSAATTLLLIWPAPTTTTLAEPNLPASRSAARSTDRCASDVVPRPIDVSDRTRRPAWTALSNSPPSTGPAARSASARSRGQADLTENLVLAGDRRAQPGGDLEQVQDHRVVEVDRQLFGKLLDRRPCRRRQVLLKVGDALVEALDHRVELGSEAGGEDDDLEQVGAVAKRGERLREIRARGS